MRVPEVHPMPKKRPKARAAKAAEPPSEPVEPSPAPAKKTCIQISPGLRDRLWKLKFRKTYEEFLSELCDAYECGSATVAEGELPIPGK